MKIHDGLGDHGGLTRRLTERERGVKFVVRRMMITRGDSDYIGCQQEGGIKEEEVDRTYDGV